MYRTVLLFIIALLAVSCTEITCNEPYILVGEECCLDANNNAICDADEPKPEELKQEPEPAPIEEYIEEEPVHEQEMNKTVKELLSKADRVKNYRYTYFGPPEEGTGIDFTYRDNILKAEYASMIYDDRNNPYNTIYLFLDSKNANAYCEKISCASPDLEIPVNFDTHYKILPEEILASIEYAEEKGTEFIDNKNTVILYFEDDRGYEGTISVWDYWGMPLKVIYESPESYKIEYRDMAVNSVSEEDISHN
jgi:hypothetical protein